MDNSISESLLNLQPTKLGQTNGYFTTSERNVELYKSQIERFYASEQLTDSIKRKYDFFISKKSVANISLQPRPCIVIPNHFAKKWLKMPKFKIVVHPFTKYPCYRKENFKPECILFFQTLSKVTSFSLTINLLENTAQQFIRHLIDTKQLAFRSESSSKAQNFIDLSKNSYLKTRYFFKIVHGSVTSFLNPPKPNLLMENPLIKLPKKKRPKKPKLSLKCPVYGCRFLRGSCPSHPD